MRILRSAYRASSSLTALYQIAQKVLYPEGDVMRLENKTAVVIGGGQSGGSTAIGNGGDSDAVCARRCESAGG